MRAVKLSHDILGELKGCLNHGWVAVAAAQLWIGNFGSAIGC